MRISAVDQTPNLFDIGDVYSPDLVEQIVATPWLDIPWQLQLNQETWARRRIDLTQMPWEKLWTEQTQKFWFRLSMALRRPLLKYNPAYTYFWVDMPGFTCGLHTDGTLPGAIQLAWHGRKNLSTQFYQDQHRTQTRFVSRFEPNNGYVMVNTTGSMNEPGLWHDMPVAVADNEFRVTSYTLLNFL